MVYTPTTWVDGSTVADAAKLNKLEQGVKDAHDTADAAAPDSHTHPVGELEATGTASPGVILGQAVSADNDGQGIWSALAPNGVIDLPNAAPNIFLNRLNVVALTLPAMSIEALALNIQAAGAAGAVLRFGIYTAAADGSLGTLIYDSGDIDASTTGYKTVTPTTPVAIPGGGYWLGVVASDSAVRFGGWEHQYMARLGGPSVAFKYITTASGSWTAGSPLPTTSALFRTNSSSPAPLLWAKAVLS